MSRFLTTNRNIELLEPYEGKLSRTVLRGEWGSNALALPDNRMSSGNYLPPAVKLVEIPKSNGSKRPLGIPTVGDRVAQMVVVMTIEPGIEPYFHEDSYAYRPNRGLRACRKAR